MTVEKKISESEFFYNKIKENYAEKADVQKYFSAFLSSSRSIIDHLLQEYNQKYDVGISLTDTLNAYEFRMHSAGNTLAMQFITWFDNEIRQINQDQIGHFMWQGRNLNIHRKTVQTNVIKVKITHDWNSRSPSTPEVSWGFQEIPNVDVLKTCEKFLDLMKKFVVDAHSQFA